MSEPGRRPAARPLAAPLHRLLARLGPRLAGELPRARVATWMGPVRGPGTAEPEAISRSLAAGRLAGRSGPWLPPWLGRHLRSPGCRAYAVLLASRLRRAGHPAGIWVGVSPTGAHAWVEIAGRAYDLAHPGGEASGERRAGFTLVRRFAP